MTDAADIVNQALEEIAGQTRITALNDGTPAGVAAGTIYTPIVEMVLRQIDPDFARKTQLLIVATATPLVPWDFEYEYPTDCLRFRQPRPQRGNYDPNDPQPIRFEVAFDTITSVKQRVILTNLEDALGVYTTNQVTEDMWDSIFRETVVRMLANPLAMAVAGRPDFAREILDEAFKFAQLAEMRDE